MREYIGLDILANWVSMLRADTDGAIWLADDDEEARFYQGCAHPLARVVPAPSLSLQLLEIVRARGIEGVVAAVRGAASVEGSQENIFRPDLGDVASTLLTARSCERAILDICGVPWLMACEKEVGPVQARAVWIARQLEQVREMCSDKALLSVAGGSCGIW